MYLVRLLVLTWQSCYWSVSHCRVQGDHLLSQLIVKIFFSPTVVFYFRPLNYIDLYYRKEPENLIQKPIGEGIEELFEYIKTPTSETFPCHPKCMAGKYRLKPWRRTTDNPWPRENDDLVPRAFSLVWGRVGKRPWHRLVTCLSYTLKSWV